MRALILFFLVTLSGTGYAKKILQATCEGGNGCIFQISEADAADYDIAEGKNNGYYQNLPENAIVVDAKINGKWERYVTTDMTRTQLDKLYGGDGFTMIYPFNPTFQPTDGQWQVKIGTVTGDICYGQTSNPFKTMLQGMAQAGNVNFPNPFHARFLMNNPNVKWRQIRPDLYKADFGNEYISLKFDVQIIDEKRIEGLFIATIKVPTKEACINKIPITYTCIKANERKDPWEDFEKPKFDIPRLEDGPKPNVPRLEDDPKPEDDLLPVNPKKDDLLPIEPGKKSKPNVPRLEDPKPNVPRLEDKPKPNVPRLEDKPKAKVERLEN
ncbi:hypothetical protein [Pedobacter insulae]|uniref:Uncharacterized protein n=1 Tax=Pedobacter insulae TaxID=414048 RepID=A0A1I2XGC9_9SPHI|nr:hypothetical protein [Pedobacter insulae]SFH12560.1 hypothetical protein SAMN04489864_105229 [Pedobacter insulae]